VSACRCATIACAAGLAATELLGSDRDRGLVESSATAMAIEAADPRPASRLSERVARKLNEGIPVVKERLRSHASCRALFSRLGSDGAAKVEDASYHAASAEQERKHCRRGVFALTTVGAPAVALCRSFARLSGQQAAIILLHEALHLAGQAEYPAVPGAPDSLAISRMVMTACWLF
jgi:hypothetical protein